MKRLFGVMIALMVALSFSPAYANLIGVDLSNDPDIAFDGTITYDASTDQFVLSGSDIQLIDVPDYTVLTDKVSMAINLTVDQTGKLVSGTMTEVVTADSIIINGVTYYKDQVLLSGDVRAFGSDVIGGYAYFDLLIDNAALTGELAGLFKSSGYDLGIYISSDNSVIWDGTFTSSFTIDPVTGDKSPVVPEPTTVLLFGVGLAGLGVVGHRRRKA